MMRLNQWQVLVVEDEADSMEVVQGILEHAGINCIPAMTAEDALHILQNTVPTLIIVDLALPGMDGWGLLNELQADHRLVAVPRVAITAYHTLELADKALQAGFDAYFPKPIEATSFVSDLQGIVEDE
ncbi:MAG: response regulator [Chloroflexi bacterium]|nr:response regulator [Chloroflexota bacterium]